jgi:hypothetical protein
MMADQQRIQENPNRLFLQARPPTIDHRNRTGHRGQLNIPQSFAGLKVAPSIYRWMNGLYGGAGYIFNSNKTIEMIILHHFQLYQLLQGLESRWLRVPILHWTEEFPVAPAI